MSIKVLFSKNNEGCVIPKKHEDDAGYDLFVDKEWLKEQGGEVIIKPLETKLIATGIRSVIPVTHYAQIQERGSTGTKGMKYGAGVIDASYRGEWFIPITNCNQNPLVITLKDEEEYKHFKCTAYSADKGIAQFVFLPVPEIEIVEATPKEIISFKTRRNEDKLGSTNK